MPRYCKLREVMTTLFSWSMHFVSCCWCYRRRWYWCSCCCRWWCTLILVHPNSTPFLKLERIWLTGLSHEMCRLFPQTHLPRFCSNTPEYGFIVAILIHFHLSIQFYGFSVCKDLNSVEPFSLPSWNDHFPLSFYIISPLLSPCISRRGQCLVIKQTWRRCRSLRSTDLRRTCTVSE